MKSIAFCALLLCLCCNRGSTQTKTAGGDLSGTYPNPSLATQATSLPKVSGNLLYSVNGMLGINRDNPAFALDVWGNNGAGLAVHYSGLGAPSINWINDTGDWHLSGPRSGEAYCPLALYWAPYDGTNRYIRFFNVNCIGNVGIGVDNPSSKLEVAGEIKASSIQITGGSDVAEPYSVHSFNGSQPTPGLVVAIDPNHIGQMRVCKAEYDRTVGGIISGANGIKPGIVLRQKGTVADGALPIASMGRVWCWCDAGANGSISAGDLLTTSRTPGHAMKVTNYDKAHGAILGKAMSPLKGGKGLVLVLISMQ